MPRTPDADPAQGDLAVRSAEDIGRAIAQARRHFDLNQAEFAEWLGADRSYVSRLESGTSVQRLDRLLAALDAVGLELRIHPKAMP